jgi:hypothetical protein
MIITPLLKWYLPNGLVTRIYQVVEYSPTKCFQTFGEAVSDERTALTFKLHIRIRLKIS